MPRVAVVTLEGVVARPSEKLVNAPLHPVGHALYEALTQVFRVVVITDTAERQELEHWLRGNGMLTSASMGLITLETDFGATFSEARARQVTRLRAMGNDVALVVDPSPAIVAAVMRLGVVGVLFGSPAYARPEFQPDAAPGIRQWGEIETAVRESNQARVSADLPDVIE